KNKLSEHLKNDLDIDIEVLDIEEISNLSLLDLASSNKDIQSKIMEIKADREERDNELDRSLPLINEKERITNVQRIDESYDTGFSGESTLDLTERYRKELSLFSKVFRSTELLMDPDEVMSIFATIVDSYTYLIKAEMVSLDEKIVFPFLLPIIEERLEGYEGKDRDNIIEFGRIM
ncbi:TPA: hypothetical protein PMD70_003694, partial [Vibrio cholerae]|nr:hypothetical protein [Vibrio cholerae]